MFLVKFLFCTIFLFMGYVLSQELDSQNGTQATETYKICSKEKDKISYIDILIEDFVNQNWEADESVCFKKTLDVMYNVKSSTLWAMWIWDSMQSPVGLLYGSKYNLGNFDECLKAPWLKTNPELRTQYCLADVSLSTEEPSYSPVDPYSHIETYISSKSKHSVKFNTFSWGVCLPVECQPKSAAKFVRSLLKNSHLGCDVSTNDIEVVSCQRAGESAELPTGFYVFLLLMVAFAAAVILCTIVNEDKYKKGNRIIKALCMKTNISSLLSSSDRDVNTIHGLKVIASGLIVIFHMVYLSVWLGIGNPVELDQNIDRYNLRVVLRFELMVDTFLMMSGLLLSRSYIETGKANPLILILKRYVRLALPMGLVLLIMKNIRNCGDGPLWPGLSEVEIDMCENNWWTTFMMLGNYIDTTNMCYPVIWSVACDFHLSIVGIVFINLYKRDRRLGVYSFFALATFAVIMPGVVTYQRGLAGVPIFNMETISNFRHYLLNNPTYIASHLRAGSYFIGFAAGYLLTKYNASNRKIISKFWSTIGIFIALAVALKVLKMSAHFYDKDPGHNRWEDVLFASLNRSIWALAMVSIVVLCEYGTVPFMESLLRWWFFIPLSKLSYGLYLIHSLLLSLVVTISRSTVHFNVIFMFLYALNLIAVCYGVIFLLHIFYEAPMIKLINMVINKYTPSRTTNGIEKSTELKIDTDVKNGTVIKNLDDKRKIA